MYDILYNYIYMYWLYDNKIVTKICTLYLLLNSFVLWSYVILSYYYNICMSSHKYLNIISGKRNTCFSTAFSKKKKIVWENIANGNIYLLEPLAMEV